MWLTPLPVPAGAPYSPTMTSPYPSPLTSPAEATLCFVLEQAEALEHLHRWGGQPLPLNASCWVLDDAVAGVAAKPCLFVRLRGAAAAVEAACPRMAADVLAEGGDAQRMDNAQAAADWIACGEQTLPFFRNVAPDLGLWRLSVPQTAPDLNLPYACLIEWHGGLRWLWAPLSALTKLREAAARVGGSASLFRAPPAIGTEAPQRFTPLSPALQQIHERLKHEFDPAGIFNRGRMYANV